MKDDQQLKEPRNERVDTTAPSGGKPYRRPELTRFGPIREVTLGGSPGIGESQNPGLFRGGG